MAPKEPLEEPLAPHPDPLLDFGSRSLPVVESIGPWYRLNPVRYERLFFDRSGKGRFDGQGQGYGILYGSRRVCCLYRMLRSRTRGAGVVSQHCKSGIWYALLQRVLLSWLT